MPGWPRVRECPPTSYVSGHLERPGRRMRAARVRPDRAIRIGAAPQTDRPAGVDRDKPPTVSRRHAERATDDRVLGKSKELETIGLLAGRWPLADRAGGIGTSRALGESSKCGSLNGRESLRWRRQGLRGQHLAQSAGHQVA